MEPRRRLHDHQYYQELLGAVALGAATPEERQAVLTHVSECAACRAELAELRAAVTALPLALPEREPSPILRYRIQAALQHELTTGVPPEFEAETEPLVAPADGTPTPAPLPPPQPIRRRSPAAFLWAAAALLLLAVSAGLLVWNVTLQQDQQTREDAVDAIAVELDLASPPAGAGAELAYLEDRDVFLLSVRNLPELADDEVYQVWLLGEGETVVPVGTFDRETSQVAVAADRAQYTTLAVTVEPGPLGSTGPTTQPFLSADLSAGDT